MAIGTTTKRHFDVFKKEIEKWVKDLGLLDWDISIEHGGVANDDTAAECQGNVTAKHAIIRLSKTFTHEANFTSNDIREAAFHEACELLLCEFGHLAESRYAIQEQIDMARHSIIARLLNCFFRKP